VNWMDGSLIVMGVALVILLVILYFSDGQTKLFKGLTQQPLRHYSHMPDVTNLQNALALLEVLSFEEKQTLIVRAFGRPCRFVHGRDSDGTAWLEAVTYFKSEDESDQNFHLSEYVKKNKERFGIG